MFKKCARVSVTLIFILSLALAYHNNARPTFLSYASDYEVYFFDGSYLPPQKISGNVLPFGVKGEACEMEKTELEKLFLDFNASLLFSEEIDGGINYYAYSPKIKYRTKINGQTINLHVFLGKDKIKVGTPVIFGSY